MKRMEGAMAKKNGLEVMAVVQPGVEQPERGEEEHPRGGDGEPREGVEAAGLAADEIRTGLKEGVPKGDEQMIGEYFRNLAEKNK